MRGLLRRGTVKSIDILDAMGNLDDECILNAKKENRSVKKGKTIKFFMVFSIAIMIFAVFALVYPGREEKKHGAERGVTYTSYVGPVFPLTAMDKVNSVTAGRNVNYDFLSYDVSQKNRICYADASVVTDSYVLTNTEEEDISFTALYPFTGEFGMDNNFFPEISIDGSRVTAGLYVGQYTGKFDMPESGEVKAVSLSSWDKYAKLLEDGIYQTTAFDAVPSLDRKVTVYCISDYSYTEDDRADNPTLELIFDLDYSKTTVFTINTDGGTDDSENKLCTRRISGIRYNADAPQGYDEPQNAYIILLGEDAMGCSLQGYREKECLEWQKLDDLRAKITKYESTLGEMLKLQIEEYSSDYMINNRYNTEERLYDLTAEGLTEYGLLSNYSIKYCTTGDLEEVCNAANMLDRIMYLSFDVTIPAKSSVRVNARMYKRASEDVGGDNTTRDGYDMVTQLGSNMFFTSQSASITNYENIEIISQNFGFNLEKGITSVKLDMDREYYWMDIKQKTTAE